MDKAERKRIDQEPWCQDLIKRLGRYKEICARLEVLETEMNADYPKTKLVATYGEKVASEVTMSGLGIPSPLEIEHRDLLFEKKLLDAAVNCLCVLDQNIIKLKYIEKFGDWHILDIYIPQNFKDDKGRPLYIGKSWYHKKKTAGLMKIARLLGYFIKSGQKVDL